MQFPPPGFHCMRESSGNIDGFMLRVDDPRISACSTPHAPVMLEIQYVTPRNSRENPRQRISESARHEAHLGTLLDMPTMDEIPYAIANYVAATKGGGVSSTIPSTFLARPACITRAFINTAETNRVEGYPQKGFMRHTNPT